jgi:hypothetical protein
VSTAVRRARGWGTLGASCVCVVPPAPRVPGAPSKAVHTCHLSRRLEQRRRRGASRHAPSRAVQCEATAIRATRSRDTARAAVCRPGYAHHAHRLVSGVGRFRRGYCSRRECYERAGGGARGRRRCFHSACWCWLARGSHPLTPLHFPQVSRGPKVESTSTLTSPECASVRERCSGTDMASKVAHPVPAPPISLPPPSTKPQAAVAIAIHSANSVLGSASASNGPLLSKEVKLDELSKYFHLPEKAVAKELGICLTSLKKLCRSYGITRWPFRKLKSLERTMRKVQTVCGLCVCV